MNSRTFCYWLQGYFELTAPQDVDSPTVHMIAEHLALVEDKEGGFCDWLQGTLDMTNESAWNAEQTQKVKARLSEEFLNVIDASYNATDRAQLNKIHKGGVIPTERHRDILC